MKPKGIRDGFLARWQRYFPGADLPLAFWYTDEPQAPAAHERARCVVCELSRARAGERLWLDAECTLCGGGKRYLGFVSELRPGFEHFLSKGIPGKMEGERYKKTPDIVRKMMADSPGFESPGRYIVFARWDLLEEADQPLAVIFFSPPDVLSGLFTLAGYDEPGRDAVTAPFGAGCDTIVQAVVLEGRSPRPRAVLGMFDVSARPCVPPDALSFAAPWEKFIRMVENMDESFLVTASWEKVRERIRRRGGKHGGTRSGDREA